MRLYKGYFATSSPGLRNSALKKKIIYFKNSPRSTKSRQLLPWRFEVFGDEGDKEAREVKQEES